MATYKHLRSSTANKRPTTSIADGQLAINTNTASPGLFFKDSAGTGIVKVGPVHVGTTAPNSVPASGGSTGNYTGEQWLDTSVSPAQMKVWNGSAWVGIVADELPVSKLQDGAARQLIQTDAAGTGVEWTSNVDVPGTLDVTSTATFDSIAQHPLGTAGAPTITFTGDTNTGIYSPGADQVAISTNGSKALEVNSDGKLIVGKTPYYLNAGSSLYFSSSSGSTAYTNTSFENTAFGYNSLISFSGTGYAGNTAFGQSTLRFATTGVFNTCIGRSAGTAITTGNSNVCLGNTAGSSITTGSNNVILGSIGGTSSLANTVIIGDGAGNERLRIDSSGRLGLGTSVPLYQLESASSTNTQLALQRSGIGRWLFGVTSALDLTFGKEGATEAMRIDSSGRVGIGTTSPATGSRLHIQNASSGATPNSQYADLTVENSAAAGITILSSASSFGGLVFGDSGSGDIAGVFYDHTNNAMIHKVNGSERARIDSSGRLLVGTSSSLYNSCRLQVVNDATANAEFISGRNDQYGPTVNLTKSRGSTGSPSIVANNDELGTINFIGYEGSPVRTGASIAAFVDGTPGASDLPSRLVFSTTADGASSPTERLRIDSQGRLLLGTSSVLASDYVLQIAGASSGNGVYYKNTTDGQNAMVFAAASGAVVGSINLTASATSYNTSSDYRLKENVVPLTGAIDRLSQLQVRRFNFIADPDRTVDGFLAHEAQAVVPECVTGTKDEVDNEGNPVYQGIDQSKLVPLLTAALQEALAEIKSLKARVTALEP